MATGIKNRNYWIREAKQQVLDNVKDTDNAVAELMDMYEESAQRMEKEIQATFAKYAKDNNMTNVEASRMLSSKEYSQWEKGIKQYIEDAAGDSKTLVELNTLAAKSQISRKEALLTNIYQNMIDLSGDMETKATDLLSDVIMVNYTKMGHVLQNGIGIRLGIAKINDTVVRQVLEYPWAEKNFSKTIWENTDKLAALAKKEITIGFINGSSVDKMAKQINDVMGRGKKVAERLVRTECSYFANKAQLMAYQEVGITQYKIIGGGCDDCRIMNGEIVDVDKAEPILTLPPFHPNCKCTTIAHFKNSIFANREKVGSDDERKLKYDAWKNKQM